MWHTFVFRVTEVSKCVTVSEKMKDVIVILLTNTGVANKDEGPEVVSMSQERCWA